MTLHASTLALRDELATPSVPAGNRRAIVATIKTQRPALLPLLDQVGAFERLLFDAIEDETNEKVAGKYEAARQTMVSIRKHVQNVDDHQHRLSNALRSWERETADILRVIAEESLGSRDAD